MADVRPRFEVHELGGEVKREKFKYDDDSNLVKYTEDEPAGWMVYFPNGSSVRIRTEAEMVRCGFFEDPELVDMETGDVVGRKSNGSLKTRSEQKTAKNKSSRQTPSEETELAT